MNGHKDCQRTIFEWNVLCFIIVIICDIRAVLPQMSTVEVFLWHRSEISYPSLNADPNWRKSPSFEHLFGVVSRSQISSLEGNFTEETHSHVLANGAPMWVHAASASCICVLCLPHPRVCLIPACRPCRVSHTEPNAINVSAHGAALWGRGHGWPGPRPERPPQHPDGQPKQHVSDKAQGGPICSVLKLTRGCTVISAHIIYTLSVCTPKDCPSGQSFRGILLLFFLQPPCCECWKIYQESNFQTLPGEFDNLVF